MRKFKLTTMFLLILGLLILTACSSDDDNAVESSEPEEEGSTGSITISPTIASTENDEVGTVTFEDVTFTKTPKNIVVFDYGFLDTLDALGVEGITGVVKEATLPSYLSKYEDDAYTHIGSLKGPLYEDIAELAPDVIFISNRQSTFYEELQEIAPVVFVGTVPEDYWNTFEASVEIAATLFDKEEEAEQLLAQFDTKFEELNEMTATYNSSLVTMYDEGSLSGFGPDSRFAYIYELYGFEYGLPEQIEASNHGSNFGFEAILNFDPEILLVIDRTAGISGSSNVQADMENDIIKKTQSYANDDIYYLDGELWYVGGGGVQSELAKIEELIEILQ